MKRGLALAAALAAGLMAFSPCLAFAERPADMESMPELVADIEDAASDYAIAYECEAVAIEEEAEEVHERHGATEPKGDLPKTGDSGGERYAICALLIFFGGYAVGYGSCERDRGRRGRK